jgi:hypothetical protein
MKTESLESGQKEISGAIVKRQQQKQGEEDDAGDEAESPRKKKKQKLRPPPTPADAPTDTAEKFEYILRVAIRDAQRQNPGKIVVILVDGGGPHTMEPYVSLRPSKMSTERIEEELRHADLWPKEGLYAAEAKRIYTNSPIPRTQWTNAELIALELGAVIVYIPLNHPHLNVIEQVWRAIKQHYRVTVGRKNLANMIECATGALTGAQGSEHVCSVVSLKRRKERTSLISRDLALNPEGDPLSENKLRGAKFMKNLPPEVDVSNVPKFKSLRVAGNLRDLQLYAHHLNQARLKQYKRGVVSETCEGLLVF